MHINDRMEFANGLIGKVAHIEDTGDVAEEVFVLEYDGEYVACSTSLDGDDFYHLYEDEWRPTLAAAVADCEKWLQG